MDPTGNLGIGLSGLLGGGSGSVFDIGFLTNSYNEIYSTSIRYSTFGSWRSSFASFGGSLYSGHRQSSFDVGWNHLAVGSSSRFSVIGEFTARARLNYYKPRVESLNSFEFDTRLKLTWETRWKLPAEIATFTEWRYPWKDRVTKARLFSFKSDYGLLKIPSRGQNIGARLADQALRMRNFSRGFTASALLVSSYNVYKAPVGMRKAVTIREAGIWAGSLTAGAIGAKTGALLGLACGPLAAACSVAGAFVGGFGGAIYGATLGESVVRRFRPWE